MDNIWFTINDTIKNNQSAALGTVVSVNSKTYPAGTKFVIYKTNNQYKIITNSFAEIDYILQDFLKASYDEVMRTRLPKIFSLQWNEEHTRVFLDPIYPTTHLVVFGGGHISVPLVTMAKLMNYQVTVIDDRPTFANSNRFPDADRVICQDFETAIQELTFHSNSYAVVVTRGHTHDKTCLTEMFKKEKYAYLGMIGSKRKIAVLFQELLEEGFDHSQLKDIYTPIGLEIGAQTPGEIAVSILSEIIMVSHLGYSSRQVK